jgi:hypothetical protein
MKGKKADREFYIFKSIIDCKVHTMNNTIDKSLTEKTPLIILNFYSKKKMKNARSRTTIGLRQKKGVLIIIFKMKYMFNDIWPIYNVLKIFK